MDLAADRLELALRFGATDVVNASEEDVPRYVDQYLSGALDLDAWWPASSRSMASMMVSQRCVQGPASRAE